MSEKEGTTSPDSGEAKILPFVRKERSVEDEWEDTDEATLALKRLSVLSSATYYKNLVDRLTILVDEKGEEVAASRLRVVEEPDLDYANLDEAEAAIASATQLFMEASDDAGIKIVKFIDDLYATAKLTRSREAIDYVTDLVARIVAARKRSS